MDSAIRAVENVMLHDTSAIAIDDKWSRVDDPFYHLEFLRRQLVDLQAALKDRVVVVKELTA